MVVDVVASYGDAMNVGVVDAVATGGQWSGASPVAGSAPQIRSRLGFSVGF